MNNISKSNHQILALYICLFLVLFSMLPWLPAEIRYVKYLIFFIPFCVLRTENNIYLRSREFLYPFVIICLFGVLTFWNANQLGGKDIFFIAAPVFLFIFFSDDNFKLDWMFWIISLLFALNQVMGADYSISLSILNSSSPFESEYSFIFGIFFCFYLIKRKFYYALLSFLFTILSMKRIAILACLVCALIIYIPKLKKFQKTIMYFFLITNFAFIFFVVLLGTGSLDEVIFDITGYHSAYLTMGRSLLYSSIAYDLIENPMMFIFPGLGFGSSYDYVLSSEFGVEQNLHSDVLKIFVENGLFIFFLFFYFLLNVKSFNLFVLAVYLNIVFYTDNVLIYVHVMFFYFLICCKLSNDEKHKNLITT